MALASHFIFLSALFWMLIEVCRLFVAVERLLNNKLDDHDHEHSTMPHLCLLAYGLPFLIVSVSKLVDLYWNDSRGYYHQSNAN